MWNQDSKLMLPLSLSPKISFWSPPHPPHPSFPSRKPHLGWTPSKLNISDKLQFTLPSLLLMGSSQSTRCFGTYSGLKSLILPLPGSQNPKGSMLTPIPGRKHSQTIFFKGYLERNQTHKRVKDKREKERKALLFPQVKYKELLQ